MTLAVLGISVGLVVITSVLRAAGASLVRTPRADALHDAAEGDHRAQIVADLLDDRARIQPALGIVLAGLLVLAAIPATWALSRLAAGVELLLALIAAGLFLVLFADMIPRTVGRRQPRTLAYRFARLLSAAVHLGDRAADLIAEVDEDEESDDDEERTEADEVELVLISQVLEFTDTIVREVMVPRPDMITIDGAASTDQALDLILAEGRSRIPVTGNGADDIVGVLYARDLLELMDGDAEPVTCRELMRMPYFVPETKRVSELLREMQGNQVHLAIVVDEFGGTAGLVTIEDLLEEIVGEIADEYDREEPMVVPLAEGGYLIDARLGVDALEELIGVDLPDEEWDTVGGLVLGLAGRVPREGESFELNGHTVTADRVQGRRVARVRVTMA